jgi:predicted RNA binding protein YcfA (HicA-like mRNA interferase family)
VTRLPALSARELVRRLRRFGYEIDHQSGSHIILRHTDPPHRRLTVPNHSTIAKGTLRAILRHAGISVDELGAQQS